MAFNKLTDWFKKCFNVDEVLKHYSNEDFSTRLRIRFLFFLNLFLFFTLVIITLLTLYSQKSNPHQTGFQLPVIFIETGLLVFLIINFGLLYRGYYRSFAHNLFLFTQVTVWLVMIFNKENILAQLDSVVYVIAILSASPLLVFDKKRHILVYSAINIITLWIYAYFYSKLNGTPYYIIIEYAIEITIAIVLTGIIAYNNSNIHKIALDKAYSDIKARTEAEKKLETSERMFREMIDLLPYTVTVTDLHGTHLMVNEAFCRNTGYTKDETIGKTAADLGFHVNEDAYLLTNKELVAKGFVENMEATVTSNDNTINYVYFSSKIIYINNQPVVLSSSIDITEKKKTDLELENYRKNLEILVKERTEELDTANEELTATNEELHAANEELELKNEMIAEKNAELNTSLQNLKNAQFKIIQNEKMASLGVLAAGVAHEINNPLNFIMGGYSALETHFTETNQLGNKKINFFLKSIKTGVERSLAIVKSLNQFSRNRDTMDEICYIHSIIDNCLIMLNNRTKQSIEIVREYSTDEIIVHGNAGKLHQVFLNILNNSCQAMNDSGRITIKTLLSKSKIIIEITDTGHGISEANLPKIIEPFFTTKDPGQGTGLGLYITYSIVQEHNGVIKFKSKENEGTSIKITFPAIPV